MKDSGSGEMDRADVSRGIESVPITQADSKLGDANDFVVSEWIQ